MGSHSVLAVSSERARRRAGKNRQHLPQRCLAPAQREGLPSAEALERPGTSLHQQTPSACAGSLGTSESGQEVLHRAGNAILSILASNN